MSAQEMVTQPLPPSRTLYLQQAAAQTVALLQRFSGNDIDFGPIALQVLDEWIDRLQRKSPVSPATRALIIAYLGQTFRHRHGGHWAIGMRGQQQLLGVVCPIAGPEEQTQFINLVEPVNRRLAGGIQDSLTLFYLITSIDLQGRL
jgi:hypothetical protein